MEKTHLLKVPVLQKVVRKVRYQLVVPVVLLVGQLVTLNITVVLVVMVRVLMEEEEEEGLVRQELVITEVEQQQEH
jgi:hypothetical protein